MSFPPSTDGTLSRCTNISSQSSSRTDSDRAQRNSGSSLPVVSERACGTGSALLTGRTINAETGATLRRLTEVLNETDPINNRTLQRLHELCMQLHASQGAIDDAIGAKLNVAPVPGLRYAALAFTQRLHAALQGKQPALVLQQPADVEAICLGLSAFANVKGFSAYPADARLMGEARHALDGITFRLLDIVEQQHGIASMRYGQLLTVHNWISRACKAGLLAADSACAPEVKMFSEDVFGEFLQGALAWSTSGQLSRHLDEHNLGKTAAELATMLQYRLVSFVGKEESLARVVAWLSSEQAFKVLLAADRGVGLSSLFSLFKRILDIGSRAGTATAKPDVAQNPSQAESDLLAALWKQMIASIAFLNPGRLLDNDGRLIAACVNLLRAMHENGLPSAWSTDQRLAYANAGRRLLDVVTNADPDSLLGLSLQTLTNLVSFIKAWHKHELQRVERPAPADAQVAARPDERPGLAAEILTRIKLAAKQVTTTLTPPRLAQPNTPEAVGGLRKGLSYLRDKHLIAPEAAEALLTALARTAAAGSESDVDASRRAESESQQALSVPLGRYVKPGSGAGVKPVRTHVVGDHPLKSQPAVTTNSETALSSSTISSRNLIVKPRYAKGDAEGFVSTSRVAKKKFVSQEVVRLGQALLGVDKAIEQEEDEQPSVESGPGKGMAAQHTSKKPSLNQAVQGKNKGGREKNRPRAAPARNRNDDIPPTLPEASALPADGVPQTPTPRQQRAIAKELYAAMEKGDEKKALAMLAGPHGERIAQYSTESMDTLLSVAIFAKMPSLALALLGTPAGSMRAAQPNISGTTCLQLAAVMGDPAIVEALLRIEDVVRGVNHKDNDGNDAVGLAVKAGHTAVLERLMQIAAVREQIPQTRYMGQTVVKLAFARDNADVLQVLLTHPELARQAANEVLVETMGSSGVQLAKTVARQAAYNGDLAMVAVLTAVAPVREREASVVGPFNLAGMALHSGCREVFLHVLKYPELQPLAGERTVSGCTPLMLAVWANDAGLFAELLRHAAVRATVLIGRQPRLPINMRWPSSLPPESFQYRDVLELAIQRDKREMVAALLRVQEVLDAVDTRGDYAQKVLLQCIQHRMPDFVQALLQRPLVGKVARIADSAGMTALHHAAQQGQTQTVETLLRMLPASEIARPNRAGKSAALLAEEAGHEELARILAAADVVTKAPVTQ